MSYASLVKALIPEYLRSSSKRKKRRTSVAALIQSSTATVALFASATLLPTSTSLAVVAERHLNTGNQSLTASKENERTVRRTSVIRKLPPIITTFDHHCPIESPLSSITSGSGTSHASSLSAEMLSYSAPSHNSPTWDEEEARTPGFGELFRRFSIYEAEFEDWNNNAE